jgi:hypothetical protein
MPGCSMKRWVSTDKAARQMKYRGNFTYRGPVPVIVNADANMCVR